MSNDLLAATTGAQVLPSRLRSARNASASKAAVASNAGLSNSRLEADGALHAILWPAECAEFDEEWQRRRGHGRGQRRQLGGSGPSELLDTVRMLCEQVLLSHEQVAAV